jgi:hypothetical protein
MRDPAPPKIETATWRVVMPLTSVLRPEPSWKLAVLAITIFAAALSVTAQVAVTTFHYDNGRTGWNSHETRLNPTNVASTQFGLLHTVTLDDQVDAQPLVVANVNITGGNHQGKHNVVYVGTDNNTVYAIDALTGDILLSPNFGSPVALPLACDNNGPNVGITSTPVIDLQRSTLYVMIYTQDATGPAYRLHALDLGNLTDKLTPQVVSASHTLTDGSTYKFNATYQRQRPGLLLANGNVYAGFGSFCDTAPGKSRGWVLGWEAGTLTPLAANQLNDTQATSSNNFYLSSIWMSGDGLVGDDQGNILFVTGNSSASSYDGVTNIQESVVKISSNLTTVLDIFTPKNEDQLDQTDLDFGSGGVLVMPDQPGTTPHLAIAAGKVGSMFLMNADNLGGFDARANHVLGTYGIGACWCGQSYFTDSDGIGRVVSSGGKSLGIWKVNTAPTVSLTIVSNAPLSTGQSPGVFTTISSNGTANPIVWALARPVSPSNTAVNLYAFNPDAGGVHMKQLVKLSAGSWPSFHGNLNEPPVVANGQVFVASDHQLQIFGLKPGKK